MAESFNQPTYFVVQCFLKYSSFEDAKDKAPDEIAAHIQRSEELHTRGAVLMAGRSWVMPMGY